MKIDTTAPASGSITYTDGYYTSASVSTTYSTGTDSASGLSNSTGKIQRAEATLSAGSCGSYGSFSDLVTEYDGSYTDTTVATGKCYKYQYLIQDAVANQATYTSANVAKIDASTPTTTDNFTNNDTWVATNQTITLTPADATSGVSWTKYCTDTSNTCTVSTGTSYTSAVTISTEGTSYFRYASQDNAGNTQTTVSKTVKIDTTAPSTTSDAGAYTYGNWSTINVTTTLSCTDTSGSGCGATFYCTDTSNTCSPSTTYTVPVEVSTAGTSYIRYYSIDSVLNTETTVSRTIKIDKVAPTTTDNFTNNDTWVATNQTITLTPADATSGVSWTKYCTDTSNTCTVSTGTSYTSAVTISTEGTSYFRYASQDNAGNTQTTVSKTVKIDTTAPASGSITYTDGYYTSASVSTTYSTGTDSASGLSNSTGKIQRAEATLSAGSCGSYGSFSDLVTEYDGSYTDTTVATGKCYKYQYLIQDAVANQATYTSANVAKIDASTPTTTDNFTNNDTWVATNQTITLTPADATSGVSWTKYCTDTSNTCTVSTGTSYTSAVTISTEGTSYFRYASQDNAGNTQTTVSKTVKIDTTAPITAINTARNGNTINSTLTCSDTSGSGCSVTYYCYDTTNTCAVSTLYTATVNFDISNTTYFRYYSVDFNSNTNSTTSSQINLQGGGGGGGGGTTTITEIIPEPTPQLPPSPPVVETPPTIIEQITGLFGGKTPETGTLYPPIAEAVPPEPQEVFRGGVIVTKTQLEKIAILPLPQSIKNLALKFPQFGTTLEKTGITKPENVKELQVAKLTFPGLSEASGATLNLPLKKFTNKEVSQIPTDFIFARIGKNNIDLKTKITFSNIGEPIQTINTIENKPLYLVVKPEIKAESIKGYIIFKSANSRSTFLDFINKLSATLSASLLEATNLKDAPNQATPAEEKGTEEVKAVKDIILSQFSYEENKDTGVWEATIISPAVSGKYEIRTKIDYSSDIDKEKAAQEVSMIMVVDPEGYVYRKDGNDETRVASAAVSIYWLNPDKKQYELWPAGNFQQQNPQITDITGRYAFLVPPGDYYIEVISQDYLTYQGQPFEVTEGSGVHSNIELKIKNWFFRIFSVERIMLALIAVLLLIITIILLYFLNRSKKISIVKNNKKH